MTEDDQAEISLSIPQGTLPSTNFCWYYLQKYIEYVQCASVALSPELIRWTLVAQPGGQMMGFALHLYQYDTASNSDRNSTALRSCVHSFYRTICTDAGGA